MSSDDSVTQDLPTDENESQDQVSQDNDSQTSVVDSGSGSEVEDKDRPSRSEKRLEQLEHEGDIAADYLEGLLDIADLDGDIDMDVEADRAMVAIVGADDLDQLVGPDGKILDALQELTRLAVTQKTGVRSRLMLDVAGYRAGRRELLTEMGQEACRQVKEEGVSVSLSPMTPYERKIIHDAVAEAGLKSESEGSEPNRYVVVVPA